LSVPYWKIHEPADKDADPNHKHEPARPVDEQHALPVGLFYVPDGTTEAVNVDEGTPLPIKVIGTTLNSVRSRVTKAIAAAGNYTAGDIVSESATSGSPWVFTNFAVTDSRPGTIFKADITCNEDSITASYRLHLFSASPSTSVLNDNVAKAMGAEDRDGYLGAITFPAMVDEGVWSRAQVDGLTFGYLPAGSILYGLLEDLSGETAETANMLMSITLWAI